MKIIKQREIIPTVSYHKNYGLKTNQETRFSFYCDADGKILMDKLTPEAKANLEKIEKGEMLVGKETIVSLGVGKHQFNDVEDAVGVCDQCEKKVVLVDAMTNECECGALYNGSGQALRDQSEWEDDY